MSVVDNGVGFSTSGSYRSAGETKFGLVGMAERARLVGGSLRMESAPGKGTAVFAEMPVVVEK